MTCADMHDGVSSAYSLPRCRCTQFMDETVDNAETPITCFHVSVKDGESTHIASYAFIAKTPLPSRVRQDTHLVIMCTTSQWKLRCPFRNFPVTNVIFIVTYYTLPPIELPDSFWMTHVYFFTIFSPISEW